MSLIQKLHTNVREANRRGIEGVKYLFLSEALRVRPVNKERKHEDVLTLPNIISVYIQGVFGSKDYEWIIFRPDDYKWRFR